MVGLEEPSQAPSPAIPPALPRPPRVPRCHIHTDFKLSPPGSRAASFSRRLPEAVPKALLECQQVTSPACPSATKAGHLSQQESRLVRQDLPLPSPGWPGLISSLSCVDTQGDLLHDLPSTEVRLPHLGFPKLSFPPPCRWVVYI